MSENFIFLAENVEEMHVALADQHVHLIKEVKKNTDNLTTPIKSQQVEPSSSTSPQVTQTGEKQEFTTPVDFKCTFIDGGGFEISTREGSESFKSINKHLILPVNDDALKLKETKVHDAEVLLKKISTLEEEQINLNKKIKNLSDENAHLEEEQISLNNKIQNLSDENALVKEEQISLNEKIQNLSNENALVKEEQISLNEKIQNLSNENALLEEEQISLNKKIQNLTDENALLREEQISLNKKIQNFTNENALLEEEQIILNKKIQSLSDKNALLVEKQIILNKKIQNLSDENALLEAEKANVAELKLVIHESNHKIKAMEMEIDGYRKQVSKAEDEISKLKEELCSKDIDQALLVSLGQTIDSLQTQLALKEARDLDMCEKVKTFAAYITKRDEQINELNTRINLLNNSHATEEDRWNSDFERLKTEFKEKCELVDHLDQKHAALMSCTDELKLKVVELEREVDSQSEVTALSLDEITKRDEQIKELNSQINLLNNSHAIEVDRWKTDIERLKKELREKCVLVDDLNQKHDALISYTDELKQKVVELERQVDRKSEVRSLGLAEITKRDEQIKELNAQINLLNDSHAIEEHRWTTDNERLKTEVREKCEIIDDLNQKHHDIDELKVKVVELEREVEAISEEKREAIRQLSITVEHYISAYRQLRQLLVAIKRMISLEEFLPCS